MLLRAGETCWRVERADRAALIVDMADYYLAARQAFLKARSTIHLLNWAFDPDTPFAPAAGGSAPAEERFGPFLRRLAEQRPELDVRILCWKSALPIAATQRFFPHRAKQCFEGSPVRFLLDATVPLGACHHQKMIIVDDRLAFCGGGDIAPDRWDTAEHLDDDPRRRSLGWRHRPYVSRHEVMGLVEGPPAAALGELFRERWRRAAGEFPPAVAAGAADLWPSTIPPQLGAIDAGVSRTQPGWRDEVEARECEALHVAAIAAARRCVYLENQYFTSPLIADVLAARLVEPDGPEVILIGAEHSPSWFDRVTMDRTRSVFLKRLRASDIHGRLHAYTPTTARGRPMIVHAKLSIIDDGLLRIGSANLNNRSGGFDTECDLSFEADPADEASRKIIAGLRSRLVAHWLGLPIRAVEQALAATGALGLAIERLRQGGQTRLKPLSPKPLGPLAAFIASYHLGDPIGAPDSWKPWERKPALENRRLAAAQAMRDLAMAGDGAPTRERPAAASGASG